MSTNENANKPDGRSIEIHFVRIPPRLSVSDSSKPPIVFLAGGPGGRGTTQTRLIEHTLGRIAGNRALIFPDYRGVGLSHGLECEREAENGNSEILLRSWRQSEIASCRKRLMDVADLTQYSTPIIADDIDQLRQALGEAKIALYAVSYGTRVATEIVRRHPGSVDIAILDGVNRPDLTLTEISVSIDRTTRLIEERCNSDQICGSRTGRLTESVRNLLSKVTNSPVTATIENPVTGTEEQVTVNKQHVQTLLRLGLLRMDVIRALPGVIMRAESGDYSPLASLIVDVHRTTRSRGRKENFYGMFLSVMCAETIEFLDLPGAYTSVSQTLLRANDVQSLEKQCGIWPKSSINAEFHAPLVSDVPVLLISGELDSVTTVENADILGRTLSHSLHLVLSNKSHVPFDDETLKCKLPVIAAALRQSGLDGVDVTCGSRMQPIEWIWPN
jgi:pimeloyl-ACP methyl ester carboxylesterase